MYIHRETTAVLRENWLKELRFWGEKYIRALYVTVLGSIFLLASWLMSSLCLLILDYITPCSFFYLCIVFSMLPYSYSRTVRGYLADEPFIEYVRPVICFYVVLSTVLHMRKFTWSSELQWVNMYNGLAAFSLISSPLNVGPENRFVCSKIGAQATICIFSWC